MDVQPIHTEEDYRHAMSRIDLLIHAQYGTPDGDELEVLIVLAEEYERRHHAIPPRVKAA